MVDLKVGGLWVRYFTEQKKGRFTRAGRLWALVEERCKEGSIEQRKHPTYCGCVNGFKDFQVFAEWCQHQIGYMNKDSNGHYWNLDKDILVRGNKEYNTDFCVFVPNALNKLLTRRQNFRGDCPIGVSKDKGFFRAQLERKILGERRLVRLFKNVDDAFLFYKVEKEKYIRQVADLYQGKVDDRVICALRNYEVMIDD